MRALSFPYYYLCTVFRHAIPLGHFQLSSFAAHRGSQHTLDHALLCFVSALIQCHSFCRMMPRQRRQISPQRYHKDHSGTLPSLQALLAGSLVLTALLHLCFLHEARGFPPPPSLKDSLRLRPQRQSLRALYSLYRFVHVANTPFFGAKAVFPREWCQLQRGKQLSTDTVDLVCPLATVCCRKRKYFATVFLLITTLAAGVNPQNPA